MYIYLSEVPKLILQYTTYLIYVAATVSFIQLPYIINENDGTVQTVLILSNEVSYTVTLGVISAGGTADGE